MVFDDLLPLKMTFEINTERTDGRTDGRRDAQLHLEKIGLDEEFSWSENDSSDALDPPPDSIYPETGRTIVAQ